MSRRHGISKYPAANKNGMDSSPSCNGFSSTIFSSFPRWRASEVESVSVCCQKIYVSIGPLLLQTQLSCFYFDLFYIVYSIFWSLAMVMKWRIYMDIHFSRSCLEILSIFHLSFRFDMFFSRRLRFGLTCLCRVCLHRRRNLWICILLVYVTQLDPQSFVCPLLLLLSWYIN